MGQCVRQGERGERDAPVVHERVSDGLADELAVLLQGVERVLHRLVDGLLDGATHLLDLVDAATRLRCRAKGCRRTQRIWESGIGMKGTEAQGSRTPSSHLVWIRNVNGWHVETALVESRPLAELLDDLHHDSLGAGGGCRRAHAVISFGFSSGESRRCPSSVADTCLSDSPPASSALLR